MMATLPMFPLGGVLLPGVVLPLHVFEPRYRQLVTDCLDSGDHEFGVVLIDRGHEVGGGDTRADVGVVAMMLQVAALDGGRFAVVTVGTRRIRVVRWLADDPYPCAEIEDWPDESGDDVSQEQIDAIAARARACAGLSVEMGDSSGVPEIELTGDPSFDSYLLAAISPLGPADQYAALCAPNPRDRLELIDRLLDDVEAGLRFRLG
jgi:Lon protease-like protein